MQNRKRIESYSTKTPKEVETPQMKKLERSKINCKKMFLKMNTKDDGECQFMLQYAGNMPNAAIC